VAALHYNRGMRAVSSVVAAVLLATVAAGPAGLGTSQAQPAPDHAPDYARAKELYKSAELAMAEARFVDAARDYSAAYEITKDPVLFYKIGSAHERSGKCDVALIYYRRYLHESRPSETFTTLTRQRITACGGNPDVTAPETGSAGSASPDTRSAAGSAATSDAGGAAVPAEVPGGGSAVTAPPPIPAGGRHRVAWILVGGSIASLTVGSVLAYSANASESDVDDLYVGLRGTPPVFDARTKARYDDLIAEGERYQMLARLSFGVAGALAIGAVIKFATDKDEPATHERAVRVTPTVSPRGAGVTAVVRF